MATQRSHQIEGEKGADPGRLVFLGYDQGALDLAYDQYAYAPNGLEVIARYASESVAVRTRIGEPQRAAYGPSDVESLEIYRTTSEAAPIFVFIHGGAWRAGAARNYGFAAPTFLDAGAHYIVLDFTNVQDVHGDISIMVEQVRRALAWVHRHAESFGGDKSRLYIGGHSSGAHIASTCLITDWARDYGLPNDLIKGALCSSGVYDMKSVRLSARNAYLMLDDEREEKLSAQRHIAHIRCPVIVSAGTLESPEFLRQAHAFSTGIRAAGGHVQEIVGKGYNHFEILETLASPDGVLGSAVLRQMNLLRE